MNFQRLFIILSLFTLITQPSFAEEQVGQTVKAVGATVAFRLNRLFSLRGEAPVFWHDELQTGAASRLEVRFKDDTKLQLGDHSKLKIDELVYEPNKHGNALFTLSQGVFRMVSGSINKMQGSRFQVNTPLATIGIRGTDFWGHQTKDKLTMALLDNGELFIQTDKGSVTLTKPRSAIVIEAGKEIGNVFTLTPDQIEQAKKTVQ